MSRHWRQGLDGKSAEGRIITWNWGHSVTSNAYSQVCHFYLAPLDPNNFTFLLKSVDPFAKDNFYIFYFLKLQTLYWQLRLQHDQQNFKALYFCVCVDLFVYCVYLFLPCLDCYFWQYLSTVMFNVNIASNYFSIVSLSSVLGFLDELSPLTITFYNHHILTSLCIYYKRTTELLCLIFGIGDLYGNL